MKDVPGHIHRVFWGLSEQIDKAADAAAQCVFDGKPKEARKCAKKIVTYATRAIQQATILIEQLKHKKETEHER